MPEIILFRFDSWLLPFCAHTLELDSPIIESLAAYFRYVDGARCRLQSQLHNFRWRDYGRDVHHYIVHFNGLYLRYLGFQADAETCLVAVHSTATALMYVVEHSVGPSYPEICAVAIAKDPQTLFHVQTKTLALCKLAVQLEPQTISLVPPGLRTPELMALAKAGFACEVNFTPALAAL